MEATYVMNGNFKNIKSIKEHATYLCSRCRTTLPLNDAQTSCSECPAITDEEIPDFFCEKVKIISITNKKLGIMYRKPLRLANKNDRKDMIMIPEVIIQIIGQPEKQCIIGIRLNITPEHTNKLLRLNYIIYIVIYL